MVKIIILIVAIIVLFVFMLFSIYKVFIKKQKGYKSSIFISLFLCIALSIFTIYLTVTKTYNKIVNEGDDFIVNVSSKTGDLTGRSATSFGKSTYDGVEKTLKNEAFISDPLKNKGVEMGKILNTNPNTLEIYLIFNKDFNGDILVKIKDMNNQEIGRSKLNLNKKEGEAGYIQFNFSELTTIETQSKIYIE